MRLLIFSLVVGLAISAGATLRPISVKEVSLMLRSGYSSESILRELAQWRIIDSPDAAMLKSLGNFGASPELCAALESGKFRVDEAAAEQARQAEAEDSAAQEAQAEKVFRDAAAILKAQRANAAAARPGRR
jgi:hypothetical protein